MKSGKCPKCGSTNVRKGRKPDKWTSDKVMVPLGGPIDGNARARLYVCLGCGLLEAYVCEPKELEKLRKKWKLATDGD